MIRPDDAPDLLAAYALSALTEAERREVETYLTDNPDARHELAQYISAAESLALAAEPELAPPLGLEGRLISHAREVRRPERIASRARRAAARRPLWRRYLPHTLAAAFAGLAIAFGILNFSGEEELRGRWVILDEQTSTRAYVTNFREQPIGVFFRELRAAPEGKVYQLWQLHADGAVLADQTFTPAADGRAALTLILPPDRPVVGFALSWEEPDGRAAGKPSTDEVVFSFPVD